MMTSRYEFKFPNTTPENRKILLAQAQEHLVDDVHGDKGAYVVTSQYFDTPQMTAFHEKVDGECSRQKFRLRYYGDQENPVQTAFMEIKSRFSNIVSKARVQLSLEGAEAILANSQELQNIEDHVIEKDLKKKDVILALQKKAALPGFRGVCLIRYLRQAWESRNDTRFRLTFDSSCTVSPPHTEIAGGWKGWPILPEEKIIMEMKFNVAIPRWARDLVAQQKIRMERFSKYAMGVTVLKKHNALPK